MNEPVIRASWAAGDPLLTRYYDTEWGMPVYEEAGVYERLSLECFQAGLSWLTVLRKREAFREVFAGFDPEDMYSVERPAVGAGWPVRAMVLGEDTVGAVDAGVAERIDAGLDLLRSLGVQTARGALDGFRQARTDTVAVIRAEAWARYRDDLRLHPEKFSDETAKRLRSGDEISAPDLVGAQWRVLEWRRRIRALLAGEFDLLILPAVPVVAPISGSAEMIETTAELTSLTAPISAAHVPAVSVPCGFSEGMPVGIQIVAGPGRDLELLSLAARMQTAQPTPPWPPARQR